MESFTFLIKERALFCWIIFSFLCFHTNMIPLSAQEKSTSDCLNGFDSYVENAMKQWHVPGMAVGVVKKSNIIFTQGYGFRDLEKRLPVDENTLFPIGSLTKAFTSVAFGYLVDEGIAELDQPIIQYCKDFQMSDTYVTEHITPRDLLCHRSGLPRHDFVLTNPNISLEKLFSILPYLDSSTGFREVFQYNSIMYRIIGYLIERISGQRWDTVIQNQILQPLKMENTNFSIDSLTGTGNYSEPYTVNYDKVSKTRFAKNNGCPAFGMVSNLRDMLNWLIMNLNNGKFMNHQIISNEYLTQAQSPQMAIPGPEPYPNPGESFTAGYGLGWYISAYRGYKVVRHGGQVTGFHAYIYLLPNESIGIVILSNGETILPGALCKEIVDRLLGLQPIDWQKYAYDRLKLALKQWDIHMTGIKNSVSKRHLSASKLKAFSGKYAHPAYGTFTIFPNDSRLIAKRGQVEYAFEYSDGDTFIRTEGELQGKRMQFFYDEHGQIDKMTMNLQWGIPPIEFRKLNIK